MSPIGSDEIILRLPDNVYRTIPFVLDGASDSCRFPFELDGEVRIEPRISQTLSADKFSPYYLVPWNFTNTGLYDLNGDGYTDLLHTCNDSLQVLFNNKGEFEQNISNVNVPTVFASFVNYFFWSGRTQQNQDIEATSLESWESIDVGTWDEDECSEISSECLESGILPNNCPEYKTCKAENYYHPEWGGLSANVDKTYIKMIDFNGDGRPDRIWANDRLAQNIFVQYNNGAAGFSDVAVPVGSPGNCGGKPGTCLELSTELHNSLRNENWQRLMDMNGDGLPDIVRSGGNSVINTGSLSSAGAISWNNYPEPAVCDGETPSLPSPCIAASLDFSRRVDDEDDIYGPDFKKNITTKTMVDMNGDGLPDSVSIHDMGVWVALNTGSAFLDEEKWMILHEKTTKQEVPYLAVSWTRQYPENWDFDDPPGYVTDGDYLGLQRSITTTENFLRDCNGDGVLDFVVPASPAAYHTARKCKLNNSGKVNRLNRILNTYTGREIQLGYTDGVRIKSDSANENARKRTVLSKVRVSSDKMQGEPVQIREYTYSDGVEDQTTREFLGWENISSKNYVEGLESELSTWEAKEYEFSSVAGLDEWGVNEVPDEYLNGTLLKHRTGYKYNSNPRIHSLVEYEYEDVPVLNTTDDVRYVYPRAVRTSRFDDNGLCLHGEDATGNCRNRESKTTQVSIDTEYGYITTRIVSDTGDLQVDISDNITVVDNFELVGKPLDSGHRVQLTSHQIKQYSNPLSDESYEYDAYGNLILKTQATSVGNQIITHYEYSSGLRLLESTWIEGRLPTEFYYEFNFDDNEWATRKITTLPDGSTNDEYYDFQNLLLQSTINDGATLYNTYDNRGRLTGTGNHIADGININYIYSVLVGWDTKFKVTAVGYQDGEEMRIAQYVDPIGRLLQTQKRVLIDSRPQWVVSGPVEYDDFGRVASVGKNVLVDSKIDYLGYQSSVENIEPVTYRYDDIGRLNRILDSDGLERTIEREILSGWSDPVNDVDLHQTLYVETTADQLNNRHKVFKDINGNVLLEYLIDPDENTSVTQKISHTALEHEIIDPQGKTSRYYLDYLGRLARLNTPDAGETRYVYNDFGKLGQVVRIGKDETEAPVITTYGYDDAGRIEYIDNEDDARNVLVQYYSADADEWNRNKVAQVVVGFDDIYFEEIVAARDSSDLTTLYAYDMDSVTKIVAEGDGGSNISMLGYMEYHADAYGRTRSIQYPDGEVVNYSYDMSGRLQRVTGNRGDEYISDITYNKDGQRESVTYGNGVVREYEYEPASGQLSNMSVFSENSGGADMLNLTYHYNDRRLLDWVTNTIPEAPEENFRLEYGYDSFGRIGSATGAADNGDWNMENSYQFDLGTRLESSVVSGIPRVTEFLEGSSAPNVVHLYDENGVEFETKTYDYNNFGELWRVTRSDLDSGENKLQEFQFNSDGTLAGITTEENTEVSFKYDMLGNRVSKKSVSAGGVVNLTRYLSPLYSVKNDVANNHISDGTHVIATKLNNDENQVLFFTPDHLGSTVLVTDNSGTILSKSLFDPFGNTFFEDNQNGEPVENERKFTNQIYDEETGLYYFNARYYDSENGVFISPDPALDGLNHYVYAGGNPLMFNDPTGLQSISADPSYHGGGGGGHGPSGPAPLQPSGWYNGTSANFGACTWYYQNNATFETEVHASKDCGCDVNNIGPIYSGVDIGHTRNTNAYGAAVNGHGSSVSGGGSGGAGYSGGGGLGFSGRGGPTFNKGPSQFSLGNPASDYSIRKLRQFMAWIAPYMPDRYNAAYTVVTKDQSIGFDKNGLSRNPDTQSTTLIGAGISLQWNIDGPLDRDKTDLYTSVGLLSKYLGISIDSDFQWVSINIGLGLGLPLSFTQLP